MQYRPKFEAINGVKPHHLCYKKHKCTKADCEYLHPTWLEYNKDVCIHFLQHKCTKGADCHLKHFTWKQMQTLHQPWLWLDMFKSSKPIKGSTKSV